MSEKHVDLERATESTWAKAVTRFVVPILLALVGTASSLLLQDIRSSQAEQGDALEKQAREFSELKGDVRELNTKLDSGVIWRITEIERRLNTVEQAQKTP